MSSRMGLIPPYASYFDIDWHPPSRMLKGKVLLPVLGRPFAEALEHQELKLVVIEGKFFLQYFESLFPLCAFDVPLNSASPHQRTARSVRR